MSAEQYPLPAEWPEPSARERSIQAAFERFDAACPEVYAEFKNIAEQLLATRDHYGAKSICEVIRYHRAISTGDSREPFVINNNYTSRLARKLIAEEPRFAEFFETRILKSP